MKILILGAGAVGAHGYGLAPAADTIARVLDGVLLDAGIAIEFDLSPQTKDAGRRLAARLHPYVAGSFTITTTISHDTAPNTVVTSTATGSPRRRPGNGMSGGRPRRSSCEQSQREHS